MRGNGALLLVGLSPALGRVITMPRLRPGGVNRATGYVEAAAGKATNAARVASQLGRTAILVTPLGRDDREKFAALVRADGITLREVSYPGRVRWALTLVNEIPGADSAHPGESTEIVINEPDPIPATVEEEILRNVRESLSGAAACVIAGSRLADITPRVLSAIARNARDSGVPLFLDVRGGDLIRALEGYESGLSSASGHAPEGPTPGGQTLPALVVKINEEEFRDTVQQAGIGPLPSFDSRPLHASDLIAFATRYRCTLLVTRGRNPVLFTDPAGNTGEAPVPTAKARNPIGSGDTLLATLAVRLTEETSLTSAVTEAVLRAARNTEFLIPGTTTGP